VTGSSLRSAARTTTRPPRRQHWGLGLALGETLATIKRLRIASRLDRASHWGLARLPTHEGGTDGEEQHDRRRRGPEWLSHQSGCSDSLDPTPKTSLAPRRRGGIGPPIQGIGLGSLRARGGGEHVRDHRQRRGKRAAIRGTVRRLEIDARFDDAAAVVEERLVGGGEVVGPALMRPVGRSAGLINVGRRPTGPAPRPSPPRRRPR
jgi:hypothetical protein